MKQEQIALRCEDGQEAVVFTKYIHNPTLPNGVKFGSEIDYEINIEDTYVGGDYKGFFGRLKRAWRAFWAKPVVYTGIYCEDKDKMRKFLGDCLHLITGEVSTTFPKLQPTDFIEVFRDKEMRFFCTDECEQFENVVHPDEDYEFKQEDITSVWRQVDNDTYKCIYRKEELDDTISPQWLDKYAIYCEDGSVTSNEELIEKGEW